MPYVYILTSFAEWGIEPPTYSTLNRDELIPLAAKHFVPIWGDVFKMGALIEALKQSDEVLCACKDDGVLGPVQLTDGWGGVFLYVLPLGDR